jgi:hypothetical protein
MLGKEAGPRCPVFSNSPVKRSNRAEKQLPQGFYRISLDFLSSIAFRTNFLAILENDFLPIYVTINVSVSVFAYTYFYWRNLSKSVICFHVPVDFVSATRKPPPNIST